MASIMFVALAGFAFALLEVAFAQKMFIVEAGVQGKTGPDVEDGLIFCPTQFSSKGISIQCTVPTAPITYSVNNNVIQVKNYSPFTISGDRDGNFNPWTDYPTDGAPFLISCKNNQGVEVAKTITFSCDNSPPVPEEPKMIIIEAGIQGKTGPDVEDGLVFCPTQFSSKGFSIRCTVMTAPITYSEKNNVIQVENFSPFVISGDKNGFTNAWTDYPTGGSPTTISCKNNQGVEVKKTIAFSCDNPQVPDPALIGSGGFRNVEGISGGAFTRHEPCATAVAGKVYLIGGRLGNKAVFVFDPTTKTWTKLGHTKREMHHHQCAVLDDRYIYIGSSWYGSWPDEIAHDVLFVYDTVTDKWTEEPGLGARARGAGAAAFYKGKLYVAMGNRGGHRKGSLSVGEFDMYDPQTKQWTSLPSAPDARDHTTGAIISDSFCVGGGRLTGADDYWQASVEPLNCYNFLANSWEQKASLPSPRAGTMAAATCQGLLMIAGGQGLGPNGPQSFTRVDFYDLTTNAFKEPGFMTQARHGTGAGVMDCSCGNIYMTYGAGGVGASLDITTTQAWSPDGVVRNC